MTLTLKKEDKIMKYVFLKDIFLDEDRQKCWIIEAYDKHHAIGKAIVGGYSDSIDDFYRDLENDKISIAEIGMEI